MGTLVHVGFLSNFGVLNYLLEGISVISNLIWIHSVVK